MCEDTVQHVSKLYVPAAVLLRRVVVADEVAAVVALTEVQRVVIAPNGYLARLFLFLEDVAVVLLRLLGRYVELAIGEDQRLVRVIGILYRCPQLLSHGGQGGLQDLTASATGGLALLPQAFPYHHEVTACTREGHIQEVKVIDDVLQVLLPVVRLIDRSLHGSAREVDGNDRQLVIGLALAVGLAPDGTQLLHLPVAERYYDVMELQALTLVDGAQLYTVDLIAGDGILMERVVPQLQEAADIGGVVLKVVGEDVLEGTEIGALVVEFLQLERFYETVDEVCQRLGQHLTVAFADELPRQLLVHLLVAHYQFCRRVVVP